MPPAARFPHFVQVPSGTFLLHVARTSQFTWIYTMSSASPTQLCFMAPSSVSPRFTELIPRRGWPAAYLAELSTAFSLTFQLVASIFLQSLCPTQFVQESGRFTNFALVLVIHRSMLSPLGRGISRTVSREMLFQILLLGEPMFHNALVKDMRGHPIPRGAGRNPESGRNAAGVGTDLNKGFHSGARRSISPEVSKKSAG